MAKRRLFSRLMLESSRASKRIYFDPSSVMKPKRPWLDIDVGEHFTVPFEDVSPTTLSGAAQRWSNICGRVYSVNKMPDCWKVTRTA